MAWNELPDRLKIMETIEALKKNGIEASLFETGADAKKELLSFIPEESEVFTMTSQTLEELSIASEINKSGNFFSVRNELNSLSEKHKKREMRKLGAAPDITIGSAHAITQDGKIFVASNTGSQQPAYAYGAEKVFFIIGAQKIVKNFDEAIKRIYEYVYPLEDARSKKAYGTGSNVSKILIINKEVQPGRIKVFIIDEVLGF